MLKAPIDAPQSIAPALLTEHEAAVLLHVSPRSLQNWRVRGGGPQFVKINRRMVRYRASDLLSWVHAQTRSNTSEAAA